MKFQIGNPIYVKLKNGKIKYGTIEDIEYLHFRQFIIEPSLKCVYKIELENGTMVYRTNLDINRTIFYNK